MRKKSLAAALISTLLIQTPAFAAAIKQYVTGKISGATTVDRVGFFGPAGTDLNGKAVTIYFQYGSNDFASGGCSAPPGATCDLRFSKVLKPGTPESLADIATPQSVLVQIELNGVGRSFAPFRQGAVYFFNSPGSPGQFEIFSDRIRDASNPAPAVEVELFYAKTTAFGAQFLPDNHPVNVTYRGDGNQTSFQIFAPVPGASPVYETLTFTVTGYGK